MKKGLLFGVLFTVVTVARADKDKRFELRECIEIALAQHEQIGMANADVAAAEAAKTGSLAGFLPQISVGGSAAYYRDAPLESPSDAELNTSTLGAVSGGIYQVYLTVREKIFDGGGSWNTARRAGEELKHARLSQVATRDSIALNVISAFFALLTETKKQEVLDTALGISRAQLHFAESRFEIGTGNRADVAVAKVSCGEDEITAAEQRRRVFASMVRLNAAMGRPPGAPLAISPPVGDPALPDTLDARDPEANALVRAASAATKMAETDVAIAKAGYWPTLLGTAFFTRFGDAPSDIFDVADQNQNFGAMLALTYPLFEGFSTRSRVETAKAVAIRRGHEQQLVKRDLNAMLKEALNDIESLKSIAKIDEKNVAAAEESLKLARERYNLGLGTAFELRDAQLTATRVHLAAVETQVKLHLAIAAYHYTRGDLLDVYMP